MSIIMGLWDLDWILQGLWLGSAWIVDGDFWDLCRDLCVLGLGSTEIRFTV